MKPFPHPNRPLSAILETRPVFGGLLLILAIHFLAAVPEAAEPEPPMVSVQILPSAEVADDRIRLGDVAVISAPRSIRNQLESISIGNAPRPGLKRFLPRTKIFYAIRSSRILAAPPIFRGAESTQVQRSFQAITEADLAQALHRYVEARLPEAEFKIKRPTLHGRNQFPVGKLTVSVVRHNTNQILGSVTFVLSVRIGLQQADTATASAWIQRFEKVVFTRQAVDRNHIITDQDLCLRKLDLSRAPSNLCMNIEDAVGKKAKQNLRSDTVVRDHMLEVPPTIYKGDRVKIVAGRGRLLVSARGRAKTDGYQDQQIKVQNIHSQKIVIGRVVDHATVRVNF